MELITLIAIGVAAWFGFKKYKSQQPGTQYGKQNTRATVQPQATHANSVSKFFNQDNEYKSSNTTEIANHLQLISDGIKQQQPSSLIINGQTITIPPDARLFFGFEREWNGNEIEISIKWRE